MWGSSLPVQNLYTAFLTVPCSPLKISAFKAYALRLHHLPPLLAIYLDLWLLPLKKKKKKISTLFTIAIFNIIPVIIMGDFNICHLNTSPIPRDPRIDRE